MRCAIHQPQFLPWLGRFHKIAMSDVFVFLDNVQFQKNEFQNRNRIPTPHGSNMNPAKIYMGDSGSFTIGYFLAVLVVYGEWSTSPAQSLVCGCLVVALPVFDLGLTSLLRIRYGIVRSIGEILSYSDTDHLSHRLIKLGLSHRRMLLVLLGVHGVCCLVGVYLAHESLGTMVGVLAGLGVAIAGFAVYVNRASSRSGLWSEQRPRNSPKPDRP